MANPFRIVKLLMERKETELQAEVARSKASTEILENIGRGWHVDQEDGRGWEILGAAYKGETGWDQRVEAAVARRLVRTDENANAALMGMLQYIVGYGVKMIPKSKDPRVAYIWKDFSTDPRNRWELRVREIVKRWLRDGEFFLRFFNTVKTGDPGADAVKTWRTTVRFVDALSIRRGKATDQTTLTDKLNAGIETDPNDAETVLRYFWVDPFDEAKTGVYSGDEIYHGKFFADMDTLRGDSFLLPIMRLFEKWQEWLKYRLVLNKVRTAIVLVKQLEGNSSQGATLASSVPDSSRVRPGVDKAPKQALKAGTTLTAGPGTTYKMESANINATDAAEDGRNIKLGMAAGSGAPEYLFGDASNNNFASALVSEAPFVKRVEYLRSELEIHLKAIYRKVIQNAVDAGAIEAPLEVNVLEVLGKKRSLTEADQTKLAAAQAGEVDADGKDAEGAEADTPGSESELELFFGVDVEFPEIVHREPKDQAAALQIERMMGWVDDRTAAEELGRDYDEIVRRQAKIEEEAAEDGNPLLKGGANPEQDQTGQEAQALLADLTPEERQAIAAARTPEDVAAILNNHVPSGASGQTGDEGGDQQ